MTTTIDYLKVSAQIASATKARELHDLNAELSHFGFSPEELKALRSKVSARFGELNHQAAATTGICAAPLGRFTLAPRTNASVLHLMGK